MNTAKGENTLLIWHSSTNSKVPGSDGRNIQNKIHQLLSHMSRFQRGKNPCVKCEGEQMSKKKQK